MSEPPMIELFNRALEAEAPERQRLLAELRASNPELAVEVEELLAAAAKEGSLLDRPVAVLPERIGPYRIERQLGLGGMGRVFLATEEREEFRRQVALKVIDRPTWAEETLRRFRDEVRILAGLEHPGIARFYAGGRAPDGTWYLALEYVEGEDLVTFALRRGLGPRERVELFLQVLEAVDFAHRHLVVHRDLKPANVLVAADGRPKLLDFGISKIIDAGGADDPATRTELRAFTPDYASPEQLRGGRASVADDIYSLGVVLYELLAGRRPFARRGAGGLDLTSREPEPPSTAARHATSPTAETSSRVRWRELTGDLDAIALKALRAEPESRYPSAAALADDLRNWLAGRPVAARRGGRRYRLGKLARRHRVALGAAALAALGLAGGTVLALWQARVAGKERDRAREVAELARREATRAERVAALLGSVFEAASPFERPGPIDARELLEQGGAQIARGLEQEPELRAQLAVELADIWLTLGEVPQATRLVEPAVADLERLRGRSDPATARAWSTLARIRRGQGRNAEARQLLENALAVQRASLGTGDLFTLRTLGRYANLLRAEGDFAGARSALEEQIAGFARLGPSATVDLAKATGDLGITLQRLEDWQGAERAHRRSRDLLVAAFGAGSPRAAVGLMNLAEVLDHQGRDAEARAALEEALRVNQKIFGEAGFPGESVARNTLAWVLLDTGDALAARAEFERAIAAAERERGQAHSDVAWPLRGLAESETRLGQLAAARTAHERALALRTAFWGRQHWEVAQSLADLAELAAKNGDGAAEERFRREALAVRRAVHPHAHPEVARAAIDLGVLLCRRGQATEGATLLAEASALGAGSAALAKEAERARAALATCSHPPR